MNNRQEQYKKKPAGFGNTRDGRIVRTVNHEKQRKILRSYNLAKLRGNLDARENEEPEATLSGTSARLQRWRKERAIKKAIESQTKKPAFKVGVVHHKYYSPPIAEGKTVVKRSPCHARGRYKIKHHPTPEKRITRATQRRLDAKLAGTYATPAAPSTSKPKASRAKNAKKRKSSVAKDMAISFAPENYSFKPPAGIEEIPLFGRYVIPTAAKHATVLTGDQFDVKDAEEKPWPRTNVPSMDTTLTQKMQSSLEAPSRSNSSIESISLRLSSGDEAPEERALNAPEVSIANTADTAIETDVPKITEKRIEIENAQLPEIETPIEVETTTPPRSGSPVPATFSPYILVSRGKNSARREQRIKLGIDRSLSDDIPTKDTVMQNLNISVEEEERTAQYFKFILEREIERLTELCDQWLAIMEEPDLTEDAQYQINQAVGQTKLLMGKKFERFRRLVMDCATGKGEMLVQCRDLQGFWDLIHMEVTDCESRFHKLDILRSRGWIEDQLPAGKKKSGKKKKKVAVAKPAISAKSSARSWILAARTKKLSSKGTDDEDVVIVTKSAETETSKARGLRTPRTRNSRSISRKSPSLPEKENRARSTPNTASKKTPSSLLKKVQLAQAVKSVRSPLAAMKISLKYKTSEVKSEISISCVNSHRTPGKRILKNSDDSSDQDSGARKSMRRVRFSDSVFVDEVTDDREMNEALENSLDLGRALAKIDAYDSDDYGDEVADSTAVRGAEKRLDFEDESFDETESAHSVESAAVEAAVRRPPSVPVIRVVPATPAKLSHQLDAIAPRQSRSRDSRY